MAAESPGAKALPQGTTFPRGLPDPGSIHWPLVPARELFELKYGKGLVESQRRTGNVPVYGTNGKCGSHDTPLFSGPGVILGRKGQGPLGVEWSDEDFWVIDTAYSLAPRRSDVDLKYSYFLIKHIGLNHLKDGTSNPTLSRDSFGAQLLPLPPISVQRAIAYILGTLDDKIELNRRMNETLEAIARALFKSWFVEFDPVRAKAEGRDHGVPQFVADLLPDSFADSELGEIPREWAVRGLDEIAHFLNGLALQNYRPVREGSLPVIKITQLRAGHTGGADAARADLDEDYIIGDGDVLFSWSGSLECVLWTGGLGALNQHLFKVTSTSFPKWWYYLWIHQHLGEFRQIAAGKATTMGHIQRHHITDARVVVPSKDVLEVADKFFAPLVERIIATRLESRTLGTLRDALLPKLVSGELRVRDADRIIGGLA